MSVRFADTDDSDDDVRASLLRSIRRRGHVGSVRGSVRDLVTLRAGLPDLEELAAAVDALGLAGTDARPSPPPPAVAESADDAPLRPPTPPPKYPRRGSDEGPLSLSATTPLPTPSSSVSSERTAPETMPVPVRARAKSVPTTTVLLDDDTPNFSFKLSPEKARHDPLINPLPPEPSQPLQAMPRPMVGEKEVESLPSRKIRGRSGTIEGIVTLEQIMFLLSKLKDPAKGVPVKDRRQRLKMVPQCFVGREAVDWLMEHLPISRRSDAVALLNQLLATGAIHHVTGDCLFEDSGQFYRFDDTQATLANVAKWNVGAVSSQRSLDSIVKEMYYSGTVSKPNAPVDDKWENLHYNPYFAVLRDQYADIYRQAATNKWIIAVPHSSSVIGATISKEDIEAHIFLPRTYTTHSHEFWTMNDRSVVVKHRTIRTGDGFPEPRSAQIFFEQIFSDDGDAWVRVNCLSRPLTPIVPALPADNDDDLDAALASVPATPSWPQSPSWHDHTSFLLSYPDNGPVLTRAIRYMQKFSTKRYKTAKAIDFIKTLSIRTTQDLIRSNHHFACCRVQDSNAVDLLYRSVVSFVTGCCFDTLFEVFVRSCRDDDAHLVRILSRLPSLSALDLGVSEEFCCPIPSAISELDQLNDHKTPLEKLHCIKRTTDLILEEIEDFVSKKNPDGPGGKPARTICTDDLLPFMIYTVIKVRPPFLQANLEYIAEFEPEIEINAEFGFHFANLRAAVEYISLDQLPTADTQDMSLPERERARVLEATAMGFEPVTAMDA